MERTFTRKHPYRKSVIRGILIYAIAILIFSAFISLVTNSIIFFIISFSVFLLISGVYVFNRERYFVESIRINEGIVQIIYTDRDERSIISGTIGEFNMKRRTQYYGKNPQSYLCITYQNQHLINQHTIGSWRFNDFNYFDNLYPTYIPGPDEVFGGKIRMKPPSD